MPEPPRSDDGSEVVVPADRAAWRAWLDEHHHRPNGVWVVYFKKGASRAGIAYDEAVEEALCFGWIDSKVQTIDEGRFRQWYSPRKPGSIWSRLNKQRIEKAIAEGRMTPAGMEKIEAARADGSWSRYDDVEDLIVPTDLRAALDAVPAAADTYEGFTASTRKAILFWVASARRDETRKRRIRRIIEAAEQGKPPVG